MSKSRKFTVSEKMFEEAVAAKMNINSKDVKIGFDDNDELVINVKRGILSESILLTDDVTYEILDVDKNELEFNYMTYTEGSFAKDAEMIIEIHTKDPSDLKEVA